MLQLKGLEYEYLAVHLRDGEQHADPFVQASPLHQVPVLEWECAARADGESEGSWESACRRLTQSLAIARYLDAAHPEPLLVPEDPFMGAQVWELAEMINAGTQPLQNFATLQRVKAMGGDMKEWAREAIQRGLGAVESRAQGTAATYLVGDELSLADVLLVPQMYNARRWGVDLEVLPKLVEIDERCAALPAFAAAHPDVQPDAES